MGLRTHAHWNICPSNFPFLEELLLISGVSDDVNHVSSTPFPVLICPGCILDKAKLLFEVWDQRKSIFSGIETKPHESQT